MKFASRIQACSPSPTFEMSAKARLLQDAGHYVVNFSIGEPDFNTATTVLQAAQEAMYRGETKYTPIPGTKALRQAIAAFAQRLYGQSYGLDEIVVGCGAKQVLFNALFALVDPGEEVLCSAPYWASYADMVALQGGRLVGVVHEKHPGGMALAEDFARMVSSKTRVLLLNSPNNPTGLIYTQAQVQQLGDWLTQHPDIWIISDDIYHALLYKQSFYCLLHTHPQLRERVVTINGVSKTYAMTGWRIGFGLAQKELIKAMTEVQGAITSGACSVAQAAAIAALSEEDERQKMLHIFEKRRRRMLTHLQKIAGVNLIEPQGAFYFFIDVRAFIGHHVKDDLALANLLLEKEHLATVWGSSFGLPGFLRLSFACSDADIDEGCARLARGLKAMV